MSKSDERNTKAILKLIELTQRGNLNWQLWNKDSVNLKNNETIGPVFVTKYNEKLLRIYEKTILVTQSDEGDLSAIVNISIGRTYPYYLRLIHLEVIDGEDVLWEFPNDSALDELYSEIKYKVSGVADLIDSLLNDTLPIKLLYFYEATTGK